MNFEFLKLFLYHNFLGPNLLEFLYLYLYLCPQFVLLLNNS